MPYQKLWLIKLSGRVIDVFDSHTEAVQRVTGSSGECELTSKEVEVDEEKKLDFSELKYLIKNIL